MPWMLLSEEEGVTLRRDREAWIVVGGLERSLCQAGMLEALLSDGQRPHLIYTGGIATVNAVFAARGRSTDLQLGWERLRAARFLPAAALDAHGAAVFSATPHTRALAALRAQLASAPPADGTSELLLLTTAGLAVTAPDANGAGPLAELFSSEVLSAEATPANLASAIANASTRGARRIIVCGADENDDAGDICLRAAIDSARSDGAEVCFLATAKRSPLALHHYLLPGLGGTERLTALGREAAQPLLRYNGGRGSR